MAVTSENHVLSIGGGTPHISTTQSKFGGSSMRIESGEYIRADSDLTTGLRLPDGSGNCTIDFWIYHEAFSVGSGTFLNLMSKYQNNDLIMHLGISNQLGIKLYFNWRQTANPTNSGQSPLTNTITQNTGQWYHMAWVKNGTGGNHNWYLDGTLLSKATNNSMTNNPQNTAEFRIGNGMSQLAGRTDGNYYIDEIRISEVARWTTSFTAPTEPHSTDDDTSLLMHCNGSNGSTIFLDEHIQNESTGVILIDTDS